MIRRLSFAGLYLPTILALMALTALLTVVHNIRDRQHESDTHASVRQFYAARMTQELREGN